MTGAVSPAAAATSIKEASKGRWDCAGKFCAVTLRVAIPDCAQPTGVNVAPTAAESSRKNFRRSVLIGVNGLVEMLHDFTGTAASPTTACGSRKVCRDLLPLANRGSHHDSMEN